MNERTTNPTIPDDMKASIVKSFKSGHVHGAVSALLKAVETLTGDTAFREECEQSIPREFKLLSMVMLLSTSYADQIAKSLAADKKDTAMKVLDTGVVTLARLHFAPVCNGSEISASIIEGAARHLGDAYRRAEAEEQRKDQLRDTLYTDKDGNVRVHL